MMVTAPALLAAFGAILIAASGVAIAEAPKCKLIRIDEWTVKPNMPVPTLEGVINNHPVLVLLDTGLSAREGALLERAAARRLGIRSQPYPGREFAGIGGETAAATGLIHELRIGQATRRNWRVMIGGEDHGQEGFLIIGNAFFQDTELEFDLAHDRVRLFKSMDCRGVSLAYWAKQPAGQARIWIDGHTKVEVLVNGNPVHAVLDSGASSTVLDSAAAARLGVTRDSPGSGPGICLRGFGKSGVDAWIGQFESFAIGHEVIRNPKIYFADLKKGLPTMMSAFFEVQKYEVPEMILGADFLRAHRVLVARGHAKLFFTYEGGTVFPTATAAPCRG